MTATLATVLAFGWLLMAGALQSPQWGWTVFHAKVSSERKAKLQARIDQLRARLEKKLQQSQARSKQAAEQMQAKVEALQKKADKEKGDAKAAIEARISRVRAEYQLRQHA